MIRAIDTHTHINHGAANDTKTDALYTAELSELTRIGKAAGIDKMFCSTFASVLSPQGVAEENAYMAELASGVEDLYQWVVIEPRTEQTFLQAREMLKSKKCVGIKIHPPYHGYTYEEYGDKIFSFAASLGATVLIHPREAADILPYADKYRDATFIVAHLGSLSHVEAIARAKHGNVYTDVATGGSIKNNVLEYAVSHVGSERILFGTDTYAAGFVRGRVEYALISEEDKANILYRNAERLFKHALDG